MPVGKSGCEQISANCDSPAGYVVHFPAILSNYNGITAYICRRFIPTTAFPASISTSIISKYNGQ